MIAAVIGGILVGVVVEMCRLTRDERDARIRAWERDQRELSRRERYANRER